MVSLKDCDKTTYSSSVVLREIQVCSLDAHKIGRAVCDFAVLGSSIAVCEFQFPAKSASANTSNDIFSVGSKIIPSLTVP